MEQKKVYLGLGGNVGNPKKTFDQVVASIKKIPKIIDLTCSPYYNTTPVSTISQENFLNAVCVVTTTLPPKELYDCLHAIEKEFGKLPKDKNAPRPIDIDILFYDECEVYEEDLQIPHPRWEERLFVLRPLSDLTDTITIQKKSGQEVIHLKEKLANFKNIHNEKVIR